MEEINIRTLVRLYLNLMELPKDIRELFEAAAEARAKAYAPYSNFQVGAALRLASGKIITGSNQENASFPSGLCAERTAVFYAGAQYPTENIIAMAITVKSLNQTVDTPISPCGACRQSLLEYEVKQGQNIPIYFRGETGKIAQVSAVQELLPFAFSGKLL